MCCVFVNNKYVANMLINKQIMNVQQIQINKYEQQNGVVLVIKNVAAK